MSAPRLHLHDDGLVLSIGFENTNDTLLSLEFGAAVYDPAVDRDRGDMLVLREWVAAVCAGLARIADLQAEVERHAHERAEFNEVVRAMAEGTADERARLQAEVERLRGEVAKERRQAERVVWRLGEQFRDAEAQVARLSRRPDLTPEQSREVHDRLYAKWEYASQVPGFTPEQRAILAALWAAAEQEGR